MEDWSPFRAYGKKRASYRLADLCVLAALAATGLWLWHGAASLPAYDWNWPLLWQFIVTKDKSGAFEAGLLLRGLLTTLRIGFWTILISLLLGGLAGRLMYRRGLALRLPFQAGLNLLRNTPPLVILFCVYFFAGNILPVTALEDGIRNLPAAVQSLIAAAIAPPGQMDRMLAAVLALGCYQATYVAEIARGALNAVPQGQWDAARALGFSRRHTLKLIIEPQALRLMLPPLTGQCISTLKDSALASLISLPDLTFQSLEIMAVSSMTFEIWLSAAALYLLTGLACAGLGRLAEKRIAFRTF